MSGVIAPELLAHATDEELAWYVQYLADLTDDEPGRHGPWELQDRQQQAEQATVGLDPSMSHEILFGGAAGPGKTEWLLWHLHDRAVRYPGFRGLLLRRTFPELRRSVVLRSLERFDRTKARYVVTENTWKFTNGSLIEFGYVENDLDVYQYQSAEYDCVAWDELTQWPAGPDETQGFAAYPYLYLFSRVRSRRSMLARGYVPHVIAATNPGGIGGTWVKRRFVDVSAPNVRTVHPLAGGRSGTRIFIPARLADNRYIDYDQYSASLANLGDELRRALLDGSWDVVEGQYFTEWSRDLHVIEPFELPSWWQRAGGIDYGYTNPWCALHAAFDGDGTCYVYRELYETGLTPGQQCERIRQSLAAGEQIAYHVADPAMWSRTGIGEPIAAQYRRYGIPLQRAINSRLAGWARVREMLRPVHDPSDGKARAGLYVFSTCRNLIRTLPMLVRSRHDPEDLDTHGEDHAADALRYLLMSRPRRSRPPVREPSSLEERLAAARREREQARIAGRDGTVDHPVLGRI